MTETAIETDVTIFEGYADSLTRRMSAAAKSFEDIQKARLAAEQRFLPDLAAPLKLAENKAANEVRRMLRQHILWPWLSERPGMGGLLTARLLGVIADPRRFPGQPCSGHHILPPNYEPGTPCPMTVWTDENVPKRAPCSGQMLAPRPHSGVRSLRHYLGLAVDPETNRLPRRRRGKQADWHIAGRTLLFMKDVGLTDQIVRNRRNPYRKVYDEAKAKVEQEQPELPPYKRNNKAKVKAVQAFVDDLLIEWKRLVVEEALAAA